MVKYFVADSCLALNHTFYVYHLFIGYASSWEEDFTQSYKEGTCLIGELLAHPARAAIFSGSAMPTIFIS